MLLRRIVAVASCSFALVACAGSPDEASPRCSTRPGEASLEIDCEPGSTWSEDAAREAEEGMRERSPEGRF